MKFKDLWEIIELDTYLFINDGEDNVDIAASNSFIPLFEELEVIQIFAENLHIKVRSAGDNEK